MKKILLLLCIICIGKVSISQYTGQQLLGTNNTLISLGNANGGAIKGNIINGVYNDTTAANLTQIDFYAGAQIFTTDYNIFWMRLKTVSTQYWFQVAGGGGGVTGLNWSLTRNFLITTPANYGFGTASNDNIPIYTNNTLQLLIPNGTGVGYTASARYKIAVIDTVSRALGWSTAASATGTVTSIATTSPITGGTITTTGTIACATCVTSAAALTSGQIVLGSGSQGTAVGNLSGDITTSGSAATTLATVNGNVGGFGSATQTGTFTVNAKGLITAASNVTITPAESSITFTDIATNNVSTSAHGFFPKLTANSIYYVSNAGALTALTVGASGKILTGNGVTSAPTWSDPATAGTVTSIATTSPITGGTITSTGTIGCATCVVATVNPGVGIAHFAGSTQTTTSSLIVNADITNSTIDLTTKVTGDLPFANLTQIPGLSVLGVTGGSTADVAGITGANDQFLRVRSGALGFGSIVAGDMPDLNTLAWKPNGNTFGSEKSIGTNDAFAFVIETNGAEIARFSGDGLSRVSLGGFSTASGQSAIAIGSAGTTASGDGALATGDDTEASGEFAASFNTQTLASGDQSAAFNNGTTASGADALSTGNSGISSGDISATFGLNTKSKSYAGVVIGTWNDSTNATSATVFNATNRAFQIGVGTADNARANAMTVLFNGNVGIGILVPTATLHTVGTAKFDLGSDATGDIWYRNSSGFFTRLAIGSTGKKLTVVGGLPAWVDSTASTGGTVTSVSGTANQIASTGGATPVLSLVSGGTLPGAWILGTPLSMTATNVTGLPPLTGIVGWPANATGVLTNNGSGVYSYTTPAVGTLTGFTTFGSTPNANGGSISGANIILQPADGSFPGGVSTTTQTFAGAKTFAAVTANSFVPNLSTVPSNGLYLPAANTLGLAINSAAEVQLTATALSPIVDGGNSLGTTALGWQNLFGNTGFVLNIENSDWVATHTAGILTVGTGTVKITTPTNTATSVVTIDGTQTLTNKSIAESQLTFTDITTGNTSTSAHGFFPKLTSNTVYYVNNSGALVALALGASGTILTSAGATSAPTFSAPATAGTVTSVAQSFTGGLISVAGSPITSSGTLAFTVAGTSGGIPYFSGATTWATSAALTANSLVLGGGAGAAPSTVAGITTDGTSIINLGVNATTIGKVKLFGNTSGDVTILPNAVAGTATTQTLPATTGVLANRVTTGNGVSATNTDGAFAFTLGAITPTTVNGNTFTTGSSTYTGTAAQVYTFPTTTATIARTDAANTFTGIQTFSSALRSDAGIGIGAAAGSDFLLNILTTQNNAIGFKVTNSNAGAAAQVQNQLVNNAGSLAYYGISSSAFSGYAPLNSGQAFFGANAVPVSIFTQSAHAINFYPNSTLAMSLSSAGIASFVNNPILNTTSTIGHVWTASGTGGQGGWAAAAGGSPTLAATAIGYGSVGNVLTGDAASLVVDASGGEALFKVGINTTTPSVALDVVGDVNLAANGTYTVGLVNTQLSSGKIVLGDESGAVNNTYLKVDDAVSAVEAFASAGYFFLGGAAKFGNLAGTGTRSVLADANGVLSAPVSDFSVKTNINPLQSGINTVMKLKPVSFYYKDDWKNYGEGLQVGFIAQDVQRVMPGSVFMTPQTGKLGINTIDIIPVLTLAIQEQQKQIDELTELVKKLLNK